MAGAGQGSKEGASPPAQAALKRIHNDALYEQSSRARLSLEYHRTRTTAEIIESLRPGLPEGLRVKADGRIFQGNTRIRVLEERGFPIDELPREIIP